jgi:hypothetical protein
MVWATLNSVVLSLKKRYCAAMVGAEVPSPPHLALYPYWQEGTAPCESDPPLSWTGVQGALRYSLAYSYEHILGCICAIITKLKSSLLAIRLNPQSIDD